MKKPSKALPNNFSHSNLPSFIEQSFKTVSPGTDYLHNWHIDLIAQKLKEVEEKKINRLIINIPPRNLKSICVNVAWTAWLMGHNPSMKVMSASYSQALSNKHSLDCRLILNSPWYKKIFPSTEITKGESQKSKFVTTKRGFRFATSTGGTATGEGGDILIVDDPQNPSKINSKRYRESTIEWFEQTFISRLNDKKNGAIVLIMQRLHSEDLCGHLLENRANQWHLLKLPAIAEEKIMLNNIIIEPGSALHPEREDITTLNKLKCELGEYYFSAQYLQAPIPANGSMIKQSWLKYYSKNDKIEFSQIIQSWDTAIKAKEEHDYSVGITIGIAYNNYYILDVYRIKVEFPELMASVQSFAQKWKPNLILVEDKASGQSLIQTFKRDGKIPPIVPIKPQFDKITRFAKHTVLFETGRIFICREASWRLCLEQELLSFPKSKNDDQVDCISQALNYLDQRNIFGIKNF